MTEETSQNQETKEVPAQPTTQPTQDPSDNDLNINDLNAIKQIIDVASSRGAFKANEMEAVGKVYNKLSNFLAQVAVKGGQNG